MALGIALGQIPKILRQGPLAGQPQLFQPAQQRVQGGHLPIGAPNRGLAGFHLGRSPGHRANGGFVMTDGLHDQ